MHVSLERVALVESATVAWDRGLQAIAFSDPILAGDRMLVSGSEYASNVLPLLQIAQRTGASVEVIPDGPDGAVDVEAFGDMLDERVRIVSINHAPSQNGLVNDVVGIGDMLAATAPPPGISWTLPVGRSNAGRHGTHRLRRTVGDRAQVPSRPRATGFLVVSQRMLDDLEPFPADLHAATWTSLSDYALADGAARFESWEKPYAALLGMARRSTTRSTAASPRSRSASGNSQAVPGWTGRDSRCRGARSWVRSVGIVTIRVDDPAEWWQVCAHAASTRACRHRTIPRSTSAATARRAW